MTSWILAMDVTAVYVVNVTTSVKGSSYNDNVTIWTVDTICMIVMITVLIVTGVLGNAPTLIVFMKRRDKHASNTFIKTLALLDLLVCMVVMPFTIFYELHILTSDFACRLWAFSSHFSVFASNATLVAIATERYIAVCKIGHRLTIKMVNKGAVAIMCVSLLVALPSVGVFTVVDKHSLSNITCSFPHENAPDRFCHFTYSLIGMQNVTLYQISQMGMFALILLVIIILYSSVYMVLWKRTKIRKHMTTCRSRYLSVVGPTDIDESEYSLSEIKPVIENIAVTAQCDTNGENIHQHVRRNSLPSLQNGAVSNTIDLCSRRRTYSEPCEIIKTYRNSRGEQQKTVEERKVSTATKRPRISKRRVKSPSKAELAKARRYYYHIRTAKMLFLCTVVYFVTWVPYWLDIFGTTNLRVLRYLFFIAHATNPIIYGIVNKQVRIAGKRLMFNCFKSVCGVKNDNTMRSDGFTFGYFSNESDRFGVTEK